MRRPDLPAVARSPRLAAQDQALQAMFAPPAGAPLQRAVGTGQADPLADMMVTGSKSLLYGTSTARKNTSRRAMNQDLARWTGERRTIDEYNDDIGLSALMSQQDPSNIFRVREALATGNVAGWGTVVTPKLPGYAGDADLAAWITALLGRAAWVGLEDLGGNGASKAANKAALKRVKGARYKKNFISKKRFRKRQKAMTPAFIRDWLAPGKSHASVQAPMGNFAPALRQDLALWISKAFWRRTSKLGIDFTIGRGATIHMNTAANRKFNPDKATKATTTLKPGDLGKVKAKFGRLITTSEYRHLKKGLASGRFAANQVNLYDEVNDT